MITDGSFVCALCGEWRTGCMLCGTAPLKDERDKIRVIDESDRKWDMESRLIEYSIRKAAENRSKE